MSKSPEVKAACGRGLAFLEKQQEADGSFVSFSSASMRPFRRLRSWQTTFVPALMLASLAGLDSAAALRVRDRLAGFLLKQQDPNGSFNYWAKDAPEYAAEPYPNDLDDTFCALAGLYLHDPSLVDEAMLAKIVKLLLAAETAVGGPYRTWLVPPDSEPVWLDVDLAVNSNIAYFLSLIGNRLPRLDGLMGEAILADDFSSPYYPSVYAFIYYFARSYDGPHRDRLLSKARRLHKTASTDLDRALCLNARLRLGETQGLRPAVQTLLAGQRRDGSWAAAVFYADPVKDGKLYYDGGPELTTAFVLETLQLYSQTPEVSAVMPEARPAADHRAARLAVLAQARREGRSLPADLRRTTLRSLDTLAASGNGREIIGLPMEFARSLRESPVVAAEFLENLSLANLYGWLAFTIYDDFLDEEGRPGLLPAANAALRRSLDGFLQALPGDEALVREIFDTIDGANAWELAHCRFQRQDGHIRIGKLPAYGDLSKLAERSLGHTLAPIAILRAGGSSASVMRHTREALKQYLIVRQLNDDLHDWQEDLENGHITYVGTRILAGLKTGTGSQAVPELVAAARKQFWHTTLPDVCGEMREHIVVGRQALKRAGVFLDGDIISRLLDGLETSVEETLAQQDQAEKFLKHYRRKAVKI